jgi:hypothetical protein
LCQARQGVIVIQRQSTVSCPYIDDSQFPLLDKLRVIGQFASQPLKLISLHDCFLCCRCVIEDNTAEAMAFIEGEELVKQVLFTKDVTWVSIKTLSMSEGELSYVRSAYWKVSVKFIEIFFHVKLL